MASAEDKQKAREFRQNKKSGTVLSKLGSGKLGRYGKAAMLTAGLLSPEGPKGMSAFKETEGIANQADKTAKEQRLSQRDIASLRGGQQFDMAGDDQMQTLDPSGNLSDASAEANKQQIASQVTPGDQAAMRRRLDSDKLQSRNEESAEQQKGPDAGTEAARGDAQTKDTAKDDKSVKSKWQNIKNEQKKLKETRSKLLKGAKSGGAEFEALTKTANQTIKKAYNYIQSMLEGILFDFFYLIFIFGLPYLILWCARPLLSMMGMATIRVKGIQVKMVPGYSLQELPVRLGAISAIMGIFIIEWFIISLVGWYFTASWWEKLVATFDSLFSAVESFF